MAHSRKKSTTIALDPASDPLLTRAAHERGVSRSEFIRQHLALVLEQYRQHRKPASAGVIERLPQRSDERELFSSGLRQAEALAPAIIKASPTPNRS